MIREFAAWNVTLATAMTAIGTPDFPARLEALLRIILDFDILMVFGYSGVARPVVHFHNIRDQRAETVIDAYVGGPYLLDPFYAAATSQASRACGACATWRPISSQSVLQLRIFAHYALQASATRWALSAAGGRPRRGAELHPPR